MQTNDTMATVVFFFCQFKVRLESIVTITNVEGDTLLWSSSGKLGFKGVSKGTPFAAETITRKIGLEAKNNGIQ